MNTTKLELTQDEMAAYSKSGDTVVVNYRKAYNITYSPGVSGFVLSPIAGKATDLPYTQRGRFMAISPEHFRKLQVA